MNVFVKPFVVALAQALGTRANDASDGRHAAIRGLGTTCYAYVRESGCQLETHVRSKPSANEPRNFSPEPSFAPGPNARARACQAPSLTSGGY